jgi:hypothetical protein
MKTKIYLALITILLLGVIALANSSNQGHSKPKWEHKIIFANNHIDGTKSLADLQEQGWELVTVVGGENQAGGGYYYLKREK